MKDILLFIIAYILTAILVVKALSKFTSKINPYLRLAIASFCYAVFFGCGIAANGGDPGFGFPAPNIIAIILMYNIQFYEGVKIGIYILGFWWILIFMVMLIRHLIRSRSKESAQINLEPAAELPERTSE